MSVSYDIFISAFLSKIKEYDFIETDSAQLTEETNGFLKSALADFKVCRYDFLSGTDDVIREFDVDIRDAMELGRIVDIVSDGMVLRWMKPYVFNQDNFENSLNTRSFSEHSPAELARQLSNIYNTAQKAYTNKKRDYSYDYGDLTDLHL